MAGLKVFLMLCFVGVAFSGLVDPSVDGKADSDEFDDDPLGYLAEQASSFFDEILKEDKVKVRFFHLFIAWRLFKLFLGI